jgi:hypothetical protein
MSNEEALRRKGGKLVEVVQAYGDTLWSELVGTEPENLE